MDLLLLSSLYLTRLLFVTLLFKYNVSKFFLTVFSLYPNEFESWEIAFLSTFLWPVYTVRIRTDPLDVCKPWVLLAPQSLVNLGHHPPPLLGTHPVSMTNCPWTLNFYLYSGKVLESGKHQWFFLGLARSCGQYSWWFCLTWIPQVSCCWAHLLISLCRSMSSLYQKALVRNLGVLSTWFPSLVGIFGERGWDSGAILHCRLPISLSTVFRSLWHTVVLNFLFSGSFLLLLLLLTFALLLFISNCGREGLWSRLTLSFLCGCLLIGSENIPVGIAGSKVCK